MLRGVFGGWPLGWLVLYKSTQDNQLSLNSLLDLVLLARPSCWPATLQRAHRTPAMSIGTSNQHRAAATRIGTSDHRAPATSIGTATWQ
jgi:hypothetical protein